MTILLIKKTQLGVSFFCQFSFITFAKAFHSSVFENDSTPDEFLLSYERFFSSQSEINQSTDIDNTTLPHPSILNIHKELNAGNGTDEAYPDNIAPVKKVSEAIFRKEKCMKSKVQCKNQNLKNNIVTPCFP